MDGKVPVGEDLVSLHSFIREEKQLKLHKIILIVLFTIRVIVGFAEKCQECRSHVHQFVESAVCIQTGHLKHYYYGKLQLQNAHLCRSHSALKHAGICIKMMCRQRSRFPRETFFHEVL